MAVSRGRRTSARVPLRPLLLALAAGMLLVSCRPPIAGEGGEATDSGGGSPLPTDTPAPAEALKPAELTSVSVQLFRGFGAADAALQYGQALDSYAQSNIALNLIAPIPGYDPFAVEPAPASVTLWVGAVADVAPAKAAGLDLVTVGEITGRDATVLAVPSAEATAPLATLHGKTVLADTAASAASLRSAFVASGMEPAGVTIVLPDDPSAPFDPTPLFDGTAAAAAVSRYDGWARVEEGLVATEADPASWTQRPLTPADAAPLGELVWAQKTDVADPALRPAITAFLGVVAQSQIACSQAVEDCAGAAAAQSDRTPEGIAWSIDQLDRLLFPARDGIAHIDPAAWDRTIRSVASAGVPGASALTYTNDLVNAVLAALGPSLDVYGKGFVPRDDLPLLPPPDAGSSPTGPTDAAPDASSGVSPEPSAP